jgi:hypothetical protein
LIETAQARWISTLTDLGGRNTLLYYKDRRAGTLDLAGADPDALDRFCRSGTGTGCAASTCNGSAGASTGSGPTNWFYNPKAEVTKLRDAYERAVAAADGLAAPPAAEQGTPQPAGPAPEQPPAAAPGQELDLSAPPGPVRRSSP